MARSSTSAGAKLVLALISRLHLRARKAVALASQKLGLALMLGAILSVSYAPAWAEERALSIYNPRNGEKITIVFKRNGAFVPDALERLNWFLRDWRENEPTKMDPRLFDLLWEMQRELGSTRPIHLVSGYRSPKTNAWLRRTSGGQAKRSHHMFGRAMDVHFPDVSVRKMRYSAMVRQVGGVGYYPTSSLPFVHIDTGRVRHWPRMGRTELALLFPNGRSKHVPSDRKRLRAGDFRKARTAAPQLAAVVSRFHDLRKNGAGRPNVPQIPDWSTGTQVAAAVPRPVTPPRPLALASLTPSAFGRPRIAPAPRLVAKPKLLETPARREARGDSQQRSEPDNGRARQNLERRMLARLAALASNAMPFTKPAGPERAAPPATLPADARSGQPNATSNAGWAVAPAFDEEHPDEMSYRPFPVAPYLTATASSDDAVFVRFDRPDASQTLGFVDVAGQLPSTRMIAGPGRVSARRHHQFAGPAIKPLKLIVPEPATRPGLQRVPGAVASSN